jgi:hypothetical protein
MLQREQQEHNKNKAVYSGESQPKFARKMSPSSSGLKSKLKQETSIKQATSGAVCYLLHAYLNVLFKVQRLTITVDEYGWRCSPDNPLKCEDLSG